MGHRGAEALMPLALAPIEYTSRINDICCAAAEEAWLTTTPSNEGEEEKGNRGGGADSPDTDPQLGLIDVAVERAPLPLGGVASPSGDPRGAEE